MPSSLTPLMIVAFVCLFLGGITGLLIASLRGGQEDSPQSGEETPPGGRPGRYQAVLRLWREKSSETPVVELDGKAYLSPEPLSIAQREVLERGVAELAGWLGVNLASSPAKDVMVPPMLDQQRVVPPQSTLPSQPVPAPAEPAPAAPSGAAPGGAPPTPSAANTAQPVKEEPKSIVGQIDMILQEMLVNTGQNNRGISLTEDPRRGVIVTVGLHRFEGIDAVTDLEVKNIIRAAVSEWEHRQEQANH